jgi:hypothetical protein
MLGIRGKRCKRQRRDERGHEERRGERISKGEIIKRFGEQRKVVL